MTEENLQAIADFGQLQAALAESERLRAVNADLLGALEYLLEPFSRRAVPGKQMREHAIEVIKKAKGE